MVLLDSILDGIKTILEANDNTKDVIKLYRTYDIAEQGISKTPFCIIGPVLNADILAEYVGSMHHFSLPVAIQLLDRAYPLPSRHQAIMDVLDKLQHDVCDALNSNPKLKEDGGSDIVLDSCISGLRYVRPSDEYVGFEVTITAKTNVE